MANNSAPTAASNNQSDAFAGFGPPEAASEEARAVLSAGSPSGPAPAAQLPLSAEQQAAQQGAQGLISPAGLQPFARDVAGRPALAQPGGTRPPVTMPGTAYGGAESLPEKQARLGINASISPQQPTPAQQRYESGTSMVIPELVMAGMGPAAAVLRNPSSIGNVLGKLITGGVKGSLYGAGAKYALRGLGAPDWLQNIAAVGAGVLGGRGELPGLMRPDEAVEEYGLTGRPQGFPYPQATPPVTPQRSYLPPEAPESIVPRQITPEPAATPQSSSATTTATPPAKPRLTIPGVAVRQTTNPLGTIPTSPQTTTTAAPQSLSNLIDKFERGEPLTLQEQLELSVPVAKQPGGREAMGRYMAGQKRMGGAQTK